MTEDHNAMRRYTRWVQEPPSALAEVLDELLTGQGLGPVRVYSYAGWHAPDTLFASARYGVSDDAATTADMARCINAANYTLRHDGIWLEITHAHHTNGSHEIQWSVVPLHNRHPDTLPVDAHPEHGPSHHLRNFTRGRCALCDHLHGHAPLYDMITVQSSLLPGASTHPTDEHTTRLYAINHEDTP